MYKNVEVIENGLKKHFISCFLFVIWFYTVILLLLFLFVVEKAGKKRLLESHLYLLGELFNGMFWEKKACGYMILFQL